ncbi:hypothetical protein PR202_ga16894 [Eleusine coracana subsp. coracana]|uniref:PHD-type domain-containing protein n=1 Tax=Eleusine coracana subsp. coracana TaxID=191504 RepID=A0AAV5CNS8_ELECO|nr:hypothetical protein QOZ80_6AG0520770 [Eleusine coracana subsp. coracana]GJM99764.1 hypothetical protein PR202_ga16894 [Eleusine coracana subsp. coracana]
MEQDAPSSIIADHPSPPSRLLSKHRPRRRAAAPRPPLPPPAAAPALRGQPDLSLCHCCGDRFPPPQPGSKRRSVCPLSSFWRVLLLCTECLSLVRSAAICSYCLSLDNLPPEDGSAIACRRCRRCVHRSCIPGEHRTALIQPVDLDNFLCVDCCPTLRSKNGGINLGLNLEVYMRDPTSVLGGYSTRKNVELNSASKRGNDEPALFGIGGGQSDGRGSGDPELLDEELALQLHLAMNGSRRISRSGSSSGGGSAEQDRVTRDVIGRNGNGEQEICVTNMMDQLDDESDQACSKDRYRIRKPKTPLATVVLALECVKGKRTQKSMEAKRKDPPETKLQHGSVDRYKKKYYSKRNSGKQVKVENVACETMRDGKDTDDRGGSGAAPVK